MQKIIITVFLIFTFSISIFGQDEDSEPILIDEFGSIGIGDYLHRLDVLASEILHKADGTKGLIQVYGGSKPDNYAYPFARRAYYYDYLVNSRRFDPKKLILQNCDFSQEKIFTRFFLIKKDSQIPECDENVFVPSKTTLFSTRDYENPHFYLDYPYPVPNVTLTSTAENELMNKLMKKSPNSKIVLIGYLGSNVHIDYDAEPNSDNDYPEIRKPDSPDLINKILNEQKDGLINSGIPSSKISTVKGGYVDGTRKVEIWFIPKNGEIPKPQPNYFPNKKK